MRFLINFLLRWVQWGSLINSILDAADFISLDQYKIDTPLIR